MAERWTYDAREFLQELQEMTPLEQEAHVHRRMNEIADRVESELGEFRNSETRPKGYVVTQEREVKVAAKTPTDAVRLAAALFADSADAPNRHVRETSISAREEY